MASTYSPNLRIELIGYGEQNNTWGTTTNTNLGTLIEQAIAGKAAVDVTAGNVTLTVVDGATDQSRQMILAITGTPGVARTVTAPSVSKVYVVANGSNATITIKMATGTGVTVSSGKAKFVYCDGTDFYEATTEQASAVITNLTVSGTLTASGTITGTGFSTYLASPPAIGSTTASTGQFTDLTSTGNTILGNATADTVTINGTIQPGVVISGSSSSDALRITQTGAGNALVVEDSANPDSTPFVITTDGRQLLGHTTSLTAQGITAQIQNNGTSAGQGGGAISNTYWQANATSSAFFLNKSRSATPGSYSILSNGDGLGTIAFGGDDGTAIIRAAAIDAAVDGTPGTNDMPGRLVFSTTADGASSPTERIRIDNQGRVGIGGLASAGQTLYVAKNITGAVVSNNVYAAGQVQSDVTTTARYFRTDVTTQAAAFTLTTLSHYSAGQGTFGAGSVVTNQFGFEAPASLTGATNNYGFYSNIATPTGGGSAASSVASVSSTGTTVTVNTAVAHGLSNNQTVTISLTANATALVSGVTCTILTVGTTDFTLIGASSNTIGVSFTATGVGLGSGTVTLNQQNSGKTITVVSTTQFTYTASSSATFTSITASGTVTPTTRYNFYAAGTADNYFAGAIKGNTTIAGGYTAHAAGTTAIALGSNNVVKVTPNATATYTTTVAPAGAMASIIIVTSGTTSYTITFGTGFLTTGTLATGTVTAKTFVVNFVSDGTTMIETSRTVAM